MSGTTTVAASGGIATFNDLSFATRGSYSLIATGGSLTTARSNAFSVVSPVQLGFGQQTSNATAGATISPVVVVYVEDLNGNVITTDNSTVTLDVTSKPIGGGATLSGTTAVAATDGVATFGDLFLTTAGTYTLTATDGTDTAATSYNESTFGERRPIQAVFQRTGVFLVAQVAIACFVPREFSTPLAWLALAAIMAWGIRADGRRVPRSSVLRQWRRW